MSHNPPEPSRDVPPTVNPADRFSAAATPPPEHVPPPPPETLPLAPPRCVPVGTPPVDGYEVLAELGRGGMGVVYKARHLRLNRLVALKMILSGEFARGEEVKRFLDEAESVARLEHPNIIRIYDVNEYEGRPYFAMELADGGCLADSLAGKPLPPAEAARLTETLARAMHHAHQRGVIHRDLKPVNILLASEGTCSPAEDETGSLRLPLATPKITDFGLAKRMDSKGRTETGRVLGTVNYMAPEQAEGRSREIGPHTDVYGLGAILYELLTGGPPFQGDTLVATLEMVRNQEPRPVREINPDCPRDLETICLKCLEKSPERRYGSALDLAEDLARFQAGEPIKARPVSAWERIWRGMRRRRREVIWAGLTVLALMLLVGFLVYQGIERRQKHEEYRDAILALEETADLLEARDRSVEEMAGPFEALPRHYQQVQQRIADVSLRERAAKACAKLAEGLARHGRKDLASEACSVAERLYGDLKEVLPGKGESLDGLALVRLRHGRIRTDFQDFEAARHEFEAALADLARLCEREPDNLVYRRHHAEAHHQMGEWFNTRKKRRDAVDSYLESLKIRDTLVEAEPDNRSFRRDQARSHGYLGDTYLEMGDLDKAWAAYQASEFIRQKLVDEEPKDADARFQLARSHSNTGLFRMWEGKNDASETAYETAAAIQRQLVAEYPREADYRGDLGWTLLTLAELKLDRLGPTPKVMALATEGRQIFAALAEANCDDRNYARNVARACLILAQDTTANEERSQELIRKAGRLLKPAQREPGSEDADDLYQLAILETLLAARAVDQTPEQKRQRWDHVDEAMVYLDAAIRRGFTRATRLGERVHTLSLLWKLEPERMTNIVRRCREAVRAAGQR